MRWHVVWHIYVKELRETLRDRRMLLLLFLVPVLIQPLALIVASQLTTASKSQHDSVQPRVAIFADVPDSVRDQLREKLHAQIVDAPLANASTDIAKVASDLIHEQHVDLVIHAAHGATDSLAALQTAELELYYDSANDRSDAAYDRVATSIKELRDDVTKQRITGAHLPIGFATPYKIVEKSLGGLQRKLLDMAGRAIPPLLLVALVMGGMLPAIDLTAGEKERGTLQTLMCAPVSPSEIVWGKYLTVVCLALAGAIANCIATALSFGSIFSSAGAGKDFHVGAATIFAVIGTMIPAALLVSAVLLVVSVFARSFREANAVLTPTLLILVGVPAYLAAMPGAHLDAVTMFVPLVNLLLLCRQLFLGQAVASQYFTVMAGSMAYAIVAVNLAARVFETEQVLLGGEKPWRDVFGRSTRERLTPSPRNAFLFVAVLVVVTYYAILALAKFSVVTQLCIQQVALLLIPAIVWTRMFGFNLRETLSLRLPSARGAIGTGLLALGGWSVAQIILMIELRFFPGVMQFNDEMAKLLGPITLPVALALAVLPAICEEACFRGVVLSGLSNTGSRTIAIVGSALLFGVFHISPYHIATATAMGLVLGWAALETGSIFASLAIHLCNNGLRVVAAHVPALDNATQKPIVIAIALAATAAGLAITRNSRKPT